MQAEYSEKKNRIKLRVTTSTGLNLLCTANRSQKIKELLPHIVKLYQEVKQDQGIAQDSGIMFRPFIKYIRKDQFLIAPSELVGDIFDDNDEVFCEIGAQPYTEIVKRQSKQEKQPKPSKNLPKDSDDKLQNVGKTKKIKKKDGKIHNKQNEEKDGNQDIKNQTLQAQKLNENENDLVDKPQSSNQLQKIIKTPFVEGDKREQIRHHKKKNKNKNTSNPSHLNSQPTKNLTETNNQSVNPQTPTPLNKIMHVQKPKKSGSQKYMVQKKKPLHNQKLQQPGGSLLSDDDFSKIRQLLKKSSSASSPA